MKINDNVYMLDCTKFSHAYVVIDDDVTLIDSCVPGLTKEILSELESYKISPKDIKRILITHHDIDHIGNASELSKIFECPVYISSKDYPCVTRAEKRGGIKNILGLFMKADIPSNLLTLPESEVGNIKIIPTTGHTKGHTCFRYKDVLFAGDLLSEKSGILTPSPYIMNWNKDEIAKSCLSLDIEGINWICPAHGNPVSLNKIAWESFLGGYTNAK